MCTRRIDDASTTIEREVIDQITTGIGVRHTRRNAVCKKITAPSLRISTVSIQI